MASTYSALKIELIGTGDQTGTWGATTNVNLGDSALGEAITGSADVAFSSADVTITLVDTNATQSARNLRLNLTGTSGGARNLILGSGCQIEKLYLVNNGLADAVTVKNTTGTGIAIPAGKSAFVFNNGTNVVEAVNYAASISTGAITCTSLTDSGLTSGRVTYAGTAGLLQDSANLTFNGTTLTANTIGAYTLGGTIAGGGNQLNNIIIGTSTPLAGAFTTLSASGLVSANANLKVVNGANDFGTIQLGTSSSYVVTGGATYSGYRFEAPLGQQYDFQTGGTTRALINGSGLAVTGTFSSTLDATIYGLTVGRGGGALFNNTAFGTSVLAANITGNSNTAIGIQALTTNTSGSNNTASGLYAMYYNLSGSSNTANGASALQNNTSGSFNTASGMDALKSNLAASANTAVGYQSLYTNTASENTAIGYQAAYSNLSSVGITAVGHQCLFSVTGTANTAVGFKAGLSVTSGTANTLVGSGIMANSAGVSGSYNIAIGNSVLNVLTSGNRNIGIGPEALVATNTGVSNVAIGSYDAAGGAAVMASNTSGNYNVAVGAAALTAQSSADANTAVGYRAGGSNNNTGTNNSYFGYQAGLKNTSGSQNIFIGDRAGSESAGITGNNNGGIGAFALSKTTSGTSNFAYGDQALRENTSGSNNVAIGGNALTVNVSSNGNVAVGYQAGYKQTSGTGNNVFVGNQAGYNNVAGTGSTIIGTASGFTGGTQNNNTYIGQGTGYEATGTQNTYVGVPSATQNCGGLMTSGNYNTIIGNYSGNYGGLDIRTASNYIVLSDGQGNIRLVGKPTGDLEVTVGAAGASTGVYPGIYASYGAGLSGMGGEASLVNNLYYTGGYKFLATSGGTGGAVTIGSTGSFRVIAATNSASAGGAATVVDTLNVSVNTNLTLQGGTGSAGTGIGFPATQYASSNANTLDDYEEGTWTPSQGTMVVVGTFSSSGTYVKIGKQVTVQYSLNSTSTVSGSSSTYFSNLPFTCAVNAIGTMSNSSANQFVGAYVTGTDVYPTGAVGPNAAILGTITYFV
jgi:hypothetical protein